MSTPATCSPPALLTDAPLSAIYATMEEKRTNATAEKQRQKLAAQARIAALLTAGKRNEIDNQQKTLQLHYLHVALRDWLPSEFHTKLSEIWQDSVVVAKGGTAKTKTLTAAGNFFPDPKSGRVYVQEPKPLASAIQKKPRPPKEPKGPSVTAYQVFKQRIAGVVRDDGFVGKAATEELRRRWSDKPAMQKELYEKEARIETEKLRAAAARSAAAAWPGPPPEAPPVCRQKATLDPDATDANLLGAAEAGEGGEGSGAMTLEGGSDVTSEEDHDYEPPTGDDDPEKEDLALEEVMAEAEAMAEEEGQEEEDDDDDDEDEDEPASPNPFSDSTGAF